MNFHQRVPITLAAAILTAAVAFSQPTSGQRKSAKDTAGETKKETLKNGYSDELPRIPPKTLVEAVKSFKLRPGFKIELVAAEPLVRDPVAIDFDENGRMFVVEMPEYNQYANKEFKDHGTVKLLEDTDQDGRFDKSTVFLDKLATPAAVACYDGGIFIGVVPDILFCKDTDGDGKSDVQEKVFTGFARDHAGEAMMNSFRWGFDNRFHLSTSLAGGNVRKADQQDAKPVSTRGRGFIFDPRTRTFELTSGGGQHGMSMDDWGRKFVCSNSNPMQTLMYDGRYLARNPYLAAPNAAVSIAPGGKYTKVFRISAVEPWRILRTRLRSKGLVRGSDEGGKPAGFFTGSTGVTVYRGDAWPAEYHGDLLVGEVASNIVHRAKLEANGVGLTARRADQDVEFVASSDNWCRPVQLANAPDGNLYVIDMYRELIEGAAFLPPEILKHMHVASGMNRGRIYRVVREDFKQQPLPRLGQATITELVALLEHRNGWHRDTASRLIYERQDAAANGQLRKLAAESKLAQGRMTALYSLQGLGALSVDDVLHALDDKHPRVREHAMRLSEAFAATSPAVRGRLIELIADPDRNVRYQLAFSLGAFRTEARNTALAKLTVQDGADSWFRLAVLSSLNSGAGEVYQRLADDQTFRKSSTGSKFLITLATQIGRANRQNEIAAVLQSLNRLPASEKPLAESVVRGLVANQTGDARKRLLEAAGGKAGTLLMGLLATAQQTAVDGKRESKDRVEAIRTLGLAAFGQVKGQFAKLLDLRQPQPVQAAALETLARFNDPAVAAMLLEAWPTLSPQLRARAAETMFTRTTSITAFLDAVEAEQVGRGDVDPARIKLLQSHPDKSIRVRAAALFATAQLARRKEVVEKYQSTLQQKGNAANGKILFKKVCSACHKLEGVGTAVGADLAAIRNRGSAAVVLNILDPNREVKPQFLNYVLVTDDGRIITGLITTETANSITMRRSDGTTATVLRINIDELRSTGLSFMPEGLEKQLDIQAMADVLAYLNSIK